MRAALSLIALAVAVAGCGYKGPLYLPPPKPAAQKPKPEAAKPRPEEQKPNPAPPARSDDPSSGDGAAKE
jgi:predicted small lipoprotein YifL